MSAGADVDDVAAVMCARCQIEVPAGNFCGRCGCHLAEQPGDGPQWLRPRTFGAAPNEGVLGPRLVSTLFPHLPGRSRRPFRIALVLAGIVMIGFALMKMPAAGIAVAALGLPLLFVFYLRAAGVDLGISRIELMVVAGFGAILGTGWVLVSGGFVAQSYGVPLSVGLGLHALFRESAVIPTAGMVLTTLPALAVRLLRPGKRESLDGFAIGALGALAFSAAATSTRLAPQIGAGLIAHARPVEGLVIEAAIAGLTIPVTAAVAGGLVGILLWFHPPVGDGEERPGRVRAVLALVTVAVLLIHAAMGAVDMVGVGQITMVAVHLLLTVIALVALRIAVQLALLHETHDPIHQHEPLLCIHCETVVPDMAFCPACGAATRASSRASRAARRGVERPRSLIGPEAGAPGDGQTEDEYPGYALPAAVYLAPVLQRPRFSWLLGGWGVGIMTAAVVLGGLALWLTPTVQRYMCPPDCGKPPTGTPVMALPRFTAADGAFSVAYPAPGSAYELSIENGGVTARFTGGGGGVMQLFSEPARGRTDKEIAHAVIKKAYPDATLAYEIPNAMVGYQPGYGEIADTWPQSANASSSRIRVLVMTAVKNDLALIAFATGPYRAFGPDFGPGPPSGANLEIAQDMGKYVNSFQWSGDPPR